MALRQFLQLVTSGKSGKSGNSDRGNAPVPLATHVARIVPPDCRAWKDQLHQLLRLKDESSMLTLATELLDHYESFADEEKLVFFNHLLAEFRADADQLAAAIECYQLDPNPANVQQLNAASVPARRALFEIFNMTLGGTERLVQMRADLLGFVREYKALKAVDSDLQVLFSSWFNRGFLSLERISWETPAFVLERLMKYEAVHKIAGWDDLRKRVSSGRRCYAFFHPALPHEPIIFVQVALVEQMSSSVDDIIRSDVPPVDETEANTAIFYSISNCQLGLRGIAFGDLLIKQVVEQIKADLPQVNTFATLSPVPGFGKWLAKADKASELPDLSESEQELLKALLDQSDTAWPDDVAQCKQLEPLLKRLCAHYMVSAKSGTQPLDPVSRFHLRNGARLDRVNWLGDRSPKGLAESHGLLVNYVYDADVVTRNHERYVYEDAVICSKAVLELAKK